MKTQNEISAKTQQARSVFEVAATCFSAFFFVVSAFSSVASISASGATAGDVQRGKELFEKRCGGCHSLDSDKEGPRLRGVLGRKAGTVSSFQYSESLKSANFIWNEGLLDKWLIDTNSVVPDSDMDFHVPKADERTDIIQFLREDSRK